MSEPLIRVESRGAYFPETNIDTDIIFPARFLLRTEREGLGECAFLDRRRLANGAEDPEFPLNRDGWRDAKVIVAGAGFGCGSSREHAVWALVDIGIRVVIAPSFGEIFSGNATKNGLLTVRLPAETCTALGRQADAGETFVLDMQKQTLHVAGERVCELGLSTDAQQAFLKGWDELDVIANRDLDDIRNFEQAHRMRQPWLFADI